MHQNSLSSSTLKNRDMGTKNPLIYNNNKIDGFDQKQIDG